MERGDAAAPTDPNDLLFYVNRTYALPSDYPVVSTSTWNACTKLGPRPTQAHDFVCVAAQLCNRHQETLRQIALESPAPEGRSFDDQELGREGKIGFGPMLEAAREAGHELRIRSGFRSYAIQQVTFRSWLEEGLRRGKSYERALEHVSSTSARAGHSEHQLGTTADLVFRFPKGVFYEGWDPEIFDKSEAMQWVFANAHRFGIVLTYGREKTGITQYAWEPWHFRFVGVEAANDIKRCGLSTEEYLSARYGVDPPAPIEPRPARRSLH